MRQTQRHFSLLPRRVSSLLSRERAKTFVCPYNRPTNYIILYICTARVRRVLLLYARGLVCINEPLQPSDELDRTVIAAHWPSICAGWCTTRGGGCFRRRTNANYAADLSRTERTAEVRARVVTARITPGRRRYIESQPPRYRSCTHNTPRLSPARLSRIRFCIFLRSQLRLILLYHLKNGSMRKSYYSNGGSKRDSNDSDKIFRRVQNVRSVPCRAPRVVPSAESLFSLFTSMHLCYYVAFCLRFVFYASEICHNTNV